MKRTALFLFSLCALLLPACPALAQRMFRSFAEIEQDSNYVKARQQVSAQLRRLAEQPQPALRPDTVPVSEVIAAWQRWWNNGRDRMKDLLLTEQVEYDRDLLLPQPNDQPPHQYEQAFMKASDMVKLRFAAYPSLPPSHWIWRTDSSTTKLFWSKPQANYAIGIDTTVLRHHMVERFGQHDLWHIAATWYSGRINLYFNFWDYCDTRICPMLNLLEVQRGEVRHIARMEESKGILAWYQYYKDHAHAPRYPLLSYPNPRSYFLQPLEHYFGGSELMLLADMIRLQLGEKWDEVYDIMDDDFYLLLQTRPDGRLSLHILKRRSMSPNDAPSSYIKSPTYLQSAVASLPAHLFGNFVTDDGRIFPYRIIIGCRANEYHRWVLQDALYYKDRHAAFSGIHYYADNLFTPQSAEQTTPPEDCDISQWWWYKPIRIGD